MLDTNRRNPEQLLKDLSMLLSIKKDRLYIAATVLDHGQKVCTLSMELAKSKSIKFGSGYKLEPKDGEVVVIADTLTHDKIMSIKLDVIGEVSFPKKLGKEVDSLVLINELA